MPRDRRHVYTYFPVSHSHRVCEVPPQHRIPMEPEAWEFSKTQSENQPMTDGPKWPSVTRTYFEHKRKGMVF